MPISKEADQLNTGSVAPPTPRQELDGRTRTRARCSGRQRRGRSEHRQQIWPIESHCSTVCEGLQKVTVVGGQTDRTANGCCNEGHERSAAARPGKVQPTMTMPCSGSKGGCERESSTKRSLLAEEVGEVPLAAATSAKSEERRNPDRSPERFPPSPAAPVRTDPLTGRRAHPVPRHTNCNDAKSRLPDGNSPASNLPRARS